MKSKNTKLSSVQLNTQVIKPSEAQIDEALKVLREDEQKNTEGESDIFIPILIMVLSFIIPFSGCILFCTKIYEKRTASREKWLMRALYTSCVCSAVYAYIASSLIRNFTDY